MSGEMSPPSWSATVINGSPSRKFAHDMMMLLPSSIDLAINYFYTLSIAMAWVS